MRSFAALVVIGFSATAIADAKIATPPQNLRPGNYRTESFVTRFDGEGSWTTAGQLGAEAQSRGRYTIEGDVITFRTEPPVCPQERVRYRLVFTQNGFRINFLDDSCKRAQQYPDWVFVRVQQ